MTPVLRLLLVLAALAVAQSFPKSELFPFGREQHLPTGDDVSSPEIAVAVPIVFYGTEYRSVYVNDNGLLSFLTEVPSFFNAQFPLTYPIIAPFYSDVDTRNAGRIYYRETQQAELLERASRDVRSHFSSAGAFQARSLFIATWDGVGRYDRVADQVNTFQVVLASDGHDTFAYFLYPSGGMQWIQGQGKNPNLPDARAQAGFMSGDGRLYTLRGSGTEQARNFDRMSNTRQAGIWMFQIGRPTGAEGNVMPADLEFSPDAERTDGRTCADTLEPCPPHSECLDQPGGSFCCVCREGLFGNGRNCVEKNSPQRMNGKVSGFVNDIALDDVDLHAYIVTEDGRTYTAVSRVPHAVGTDLQVLTPLGGVIGWLFAVSRSGAPNGFTITGGAFNRTVEVDYPQTGHHVYMEENFLGPDVFNYMRVQVRLRGTVPSVPLGSKIEVDDYEEEFTRVSPGMIRSHSSRSYRLEGNGLEVPFILDQTIHYSECVAPLSSTRLKVARNFIVYDSNEQIVRYAMTSKVSPLSVDDPCQEGRHQCGPNSQCVVEGDSFRCACAPGYQPLYEEDRSGNQAACLDTNECVLGRDNCHIFADCINLPGSFTCRCQSGYRGDGIHCERQQSCADLICDVQAECVERGSHDGPQCRCRRGYAGDGLTCRPADSDDCRQTNYCDPRAECVLNEAAQRHECRCRTGYTGDGIVCVEVSCDVAANCSPDGDCLYDEEGQAYYCACRPGYSGDGYSCNPESSRTPCDDLRPCHADARCLYDAAAGRHLCRCLPRFRGDGHACTHESVKTPCDDGNKSPCDRRAECVFDGEHHRCRCPPPYVGNGYSCRWRHDRNQCGSNRRCDDSADCVYEDGNHVCRCKEGYEGDGLTCHPTDDECNTADNCHEHAECLYDQASRHYRCKCLVGFEGDGRRDCQPGPDDGCDRCDPDAECLYDGPAHVHRCRCRSGYSGDGIKCTKDSSRLVENCDDLRPCHSDARCLYDDAAGRHLCRCLPRFRGDGHTCTHESVKTPCDDGNKSPCDRRAECVFDGEHHRCRCPPLYVGNGYSCRWRNDRRQCGPNRKCDDSADCVYEGGNHVCRCKEGYEGDGLTCRLTVDECNTDDKCHEHAECLYEKASRHNLCKCLYGFEGDGRRDCQPRPDDGCDRCDPDAECLYDGPAHVHKCRCRSGYRGDGTRCEKISIVTCDVVNNCDVRAECLMDAARGEHRCRCRAGYEGDGLRCRALRSCREDRYLCDGNAECLLAEADGEYACRCRQGYIGDGIKCSVAPQHSGGQLVFAQGMSLLRMPPSPSKGDPGQLLLMEPRQTPVGLAADCRQGRLYWADASLKVLRTALYDGSDVDIVVSEDMLSPEGVAVDWLSRNLFWTDSGKDTIEVVSLGATPYRKVLISEGLDNPRGIAVHPGLGKMYWSDWSRSTPKIESANMDGSERQEMVSDNLQLPNMIVVDFERNNLCWTDSGLGRIECIGVNGHGRRLVYTPAAYPFGIAVHGAYIYWTDWEIKFLHRVDSNGGEAEPLEVPPGGSGRMYGLVSLPSSCPAVGSPCANENGGCRYLCLAKGRGGRSCVCPDASEDDSETIDCKESV